MSASVALVLDTKAPVLLAQAVTQVEPPLPWEVVVDADEEIGGALLAFTDATGVVSEIGFVLSAQQIRAVVPTLDLATGPGRLSVMVLDTVGNVSYATVPLSVNRTPTFTGSMEIDTIFDSQMTMDHAFEATMEITESATLDAIMTIDHGFEAEFTIRSR